MAKKVTINGNNLLSSLSDDWGGVNTTQASQTIHGTTVPPGAEWGMNRGEIERFIKSSIKAQQSRVGYYVCDNAASATAKTVVASGYQLATGGCLRIKMTNANTANNVTLNINSTGAKALYYDGAQASSTNTWEAGEVLEVYYDGTQYQCASGGGGGKFATGESVKDVSITDEVVAGSAALPTSGAVAGITDLISERVQTIISEIGITLQLKPSDFVTGTLNPGEGTEGNRTDRIRSGYIKVNAGDVVAYTLNSQDILFYYYDTNKEYVSNDASWTETSGSIEIAQDGYIRVLVRIADRTPITPSELVAVITISNPDSVIGALEKNTEDIEDLQEDVEAIKNELFDINELTSSDFEQGTLDPQTGGLYPTLSTTRIRTIDFIPIAKNTTLTITPHSGQYWIIYYYTTDGGYVSSTSWTNTPFTQTFNNPALLKFLVRKSSNNAEILPSELDVEFVMKTPKLEALSMEIDGVSNDVQDLAVEVRNISKNSSDAPLFLGTLLQRTSTGTADTKRVSTQGQMVVPFVGAKIKLKLPPHYYVGIRSGATSSNMGYNDYWYGDGYEYQFREDANYFCLSFCHAPTDNFNQISAMTPEEVQALIDSGNISITVELNDASTVVTRNFECEKYAKAITRPFVSGSGNNGSLSKLPIFSHISDLHGDAKRFMQFMEYSDHIGVDAALITGDMVAMDYRSGKAYVDDIAQEYITPDLQCLGNHECLYSVATPVTENEMLARCIEKNQCTVNSSETYPTYYYKDIAAKNIRIIALNLYDGGSGNADWRLSQVQAQWLVTILASTPANYGVILMAHSPEDIPPIDSNYGLFRQPILNYTTTGAFAAKPLQKIIDSFIGKTATTVTYTLNSQEITINTDFTSLNTGVEFIAYVNGHLHSDTIGYIPNTTYRQLCLNVNCGIAVYGPNNYPWYANGSDLPRGGEGATQDCFNIYAIDRQSGTVRVAKIGSHITGDMIDRNYIVLPYKD